jgi:hypothetical protein
MLFFRTRLGPQVLHQHAVKVSFVDNKRPKSKVKANWSRQKLIGSDKHHSRKLYRPFRDKITLLAVPKQRGTSRKTCVHPELQKHLLSFYTNLSKLIKRMSVYGIKMY